MKSPAGNSSWWVLASLLISLVACNVPGSGGQAITPDLPIDLTPNITILPYQPEGILAVTETPDNGLPTATLPPGVTPSPTICIYSASFVTDVTVPDGTQFQPGESFQKTWRVRNNGCFDWASGIQLVFRQGDQMGAVAAVPIPPTTIGSTVDLTVSMIAPIGAGEHISFWQLQEPGGSLFGPLLFIRVNVSADGAGTLSPTAIPTVQLTQTPIIDTRFILENQAIDYSTDPNGCDQTTLRGTVKSGAGIGISGVFVTIRTNDGSGEDTRITDANGFFEVQLADTLTDLTYLLYLSDQAGGTLYSEVIVVRAIPDCKFNLMTATFISVSN